MSDSLQDRVARAIDPEAFDLHDTCLDFWAGRKESAIKATSAALAEIFRSDGGEEARWIEACENACPACGGSGHKGDVKPTTYTEADLERAVRAALEAALEIAGLAVKAAYTDEMQTGANKTYDAIRALDPAAIVASVKRVEGE